MYIMLICYHEVHDAQAPVLVGGGAMRIVSPGLDTLLMSPGSADFAAFIYEWYCLSNNPIFLDLQVR